MAFVDEHFDETYLWTFKGLDASMSSIRVSHLPADGGGEGDAVGATVVEQRFSRLSSKVVR
jgi:hypothetical protein